MSWVATAVVGGSFISGALANKGAKDAAKASQAGTDASIGEQARQYDQTRKDFEPWRHTGVSALDRIAKLYGLSTAGTSGSFDAQAYLQSNPDVARDPYFGSRPEEHWQRYGQFEGRASPITGATQGSSGGTPDMSAFFESPDYQFNKEQTQRAINASLVYKGRALSGAGVKEGMRYASGLASQQFGDFYSRLANIAGLGQAATSSTAAAGTNAANQNSSALINNGNNRASAYMTGAAGMNSAIQGGTSNFLLNKYLNKPSGGGYSMAMDYRGIGPTMVA